MTHKKLITATVTTALVATLMPATASAAEVSGEMIEHKGQQVSACTVKLSDAEKKEIATRAAAYASERAAFGDVILPAIAKKAGVSDADLNALIATKKIDRTKFDGIAAKAGLAPDELFALLVYGKDRDAKHYAEKYVKKFSKVATTADWTAERAQRIEAYNKALTDATARVEIFELEGKVSDSFTALITDAAGPLTKAIAASYNLKVIGSELNKACLAAAKDHKAVTVTIPAAKVAAAIDADEYKDATKKVSQENEKKKRDEEAQRQHDKSRHHDESDAGSAEGVVPWAVGLAALAAVIGAIVTFAPQVLPAGLPVPPAHM